MQHAGQRHRLLQHDGDLDPGRALLSGARPLCILASAEATLAPGIVCDGPQLRDAADGTAYELNGVARFAAGRLAGGARVGTLAREIAEQFGVPPAAAGADLVAFLGELHAHRLVSVRQSYVRELPLRLRDAWLSALSLLGLWAWPGRDYPARLYPPGARWVVVACCDAYQATLALGFVVAAAAGALVTLPSVLRGASPLAGPAAGRALYAAAVALMYVAVLVVSGVIHELGHHWAARACGLRLAGARARMFAVAVGHESAGPARDCCVSAAGPLAAGLVLVACALAIGGVTAGSAFARPAAAVLLLVAAQHGLALTPLAADGRRLAAALLALVPRC